MLRGSISKRRRPGRIPKEMARFVNWFNRTAPVLRIDPPVRGRKRARRRALSEKAATILPRRKGYYAALQKASRTLEVTPWLM